MPNDNYPFNTKRGRRLGPRANTYDPFVYDINDPYAYLYKSNENPLSYFEVQQNEYAEPRRVQVPTDFINMDFTDADQMSDENLYNPASEPPQFPVEPDKTDKAANIIQQIGNNLPVVGGLLAWAGDETRRINDAMTSTLNSGDYDLRNRYSSAGINTYNDMQNLQYQQFSRRPIMDKYNKYTKNNLLRVMAGAYRGYKAGSSLGKLSSKKDLLTSLADGDAGNGINADNLSSGFNSIGDKFFEKAGNNVANFGNVGTAITTTLGAASAIAQNVLGGNKFRSDLRFNDALNLQNKLAYNNAYSDAERNIKHNLNSNMASQRRNTFALGGQVENSEIAGITKFNTGGTHESNPNGGIPQGVGQNGKPNLVEEGEIKWNDFIFSKRIKPIKEILSEHNTAFNKDFESYADAADFILNLHKERENNPFDKASLNVQMQRLADAQEYQKIMEEAAQYGLSPEEYMSLQQTINMQNQEQDVNSFKRGGDKGRTKGYTYMGTLDASRNAYVPDNNGFGSYLRLPGVGEDGSGLKGPTHQTKSFAKNYTTLAYHLSNFIRNHYLLKRSIINLDNTTDPYAMEIELQRYEQYRQRYNYSLARATHIISFLKAASNKSGKIGQNYNEILRKALGYIKNVGQHLSEEDFQDLQRQLNNSSIVKYYSNKIAKSPSFVSLKLNSKDSFGQSDPDIIGKHPEYQIDYVPSYDQLSGITTRPINDEITISQQASNVPQRSQSSVYTTSTGNVSTGGANVRPTLSSEIYFDPQAVNSRGSNGAYNTSGNGYKITGNGGGSGNKQYRGNIDYNDPANKPYKDKIYSLSDDDWNNIKQILSDQNSYYNDLDINKIKELADDGEFGPVHEVVSTYTRPQDETINQIVQDQSNDTDNVPTSDATKAANGTVNTDVDNGEDVDEDVNEDKINNNFGSSWPMFLRMAPIFNNLRQIATQDAPDYTYANQIGSLYRPETYNPQGRYQRYTPVDQHYLDTQIQQQGNTQYGFYRNNAQSKNAADYYATLAAANTNRGITQAYLQALQQNNQNYNAAIATNNAVDFQNEANRLNVQRSNNANYANIMGNKYAAAERERLAVENAKESNYNNLAENLKNFGREMYDRWRINHDPSYSYDLNWDYRKFIPLMLADLGYDTKSNKEIYG